MLIGFSRSKIDIRCCRLPEPRSNLNKMKVRAGERRKEMSQFIRNATN